MALSNNQYDVTQLGKVDENGFTAALFPQIKDALAKKMQEIYDKLQNGDTETKFQIGNQEFTLKEWDNFLEKFDSVQDAIRAALEEKIEKQTEEHLEEENIEETSEKKPDVSPDFYDIPEEIFRKLF